MSLTLTFGAKHRQLALFEHPTVKYRTVARYAMGDPGFEGSANRIQLPTRQWKRDFFNPPPPRAFVQSGRFSAASLLLGRGHGDQLVKLCVRKPLYCVWQISGQDVPDGGSPRRR
jgi:hypothetical protein